MCVVFPQSPSNVGERRRVFFIRQVSPPPVRVVRVELQRQARPGGPPGGGAAADARRRPRCPAVPRWSSCGRG